MVRVVLFFVFILFIAVYPLLEVKNFKGNNCFKKENIIPTILRNGNFYVYNQNLIKEGNFSVLNVYNNKKLSGVDFKLKDLEKNFTLKSKFVKYLSPILKGREVKYYTKDYYLVAKSATYNEKSEVLSGKIFDLYSDSFFGKGKSFKIDKLNNIFANKIYYILKVDK